MRAVAVNVGLTCLSSAIMCQVHLIEDKYSSITSVFSFDGIFVALFLVVDLLMSWSGSYK